MGRLLDRGLHFKVPSCFWMAWLHSLMKGLWFPAVTAAAFTIRLTMGGHDKYFWPQYTHNSSPANFVNYYYCSQMQNINHRMHLAFGFTGYPDDSFHLLSSLTLWKGWSNDIKAESRLFLHTFLIKYKHCDFGPEKITFLKKMFLGVGAWRAFCVHHFQFHSRYALAKTFILNVFPLSLTQSSFLK